MFEKKTGIVSVCVIVLSILVLIVPFIMNILFAVPASDDFTQYKDSFITFKGALQGANDLYMTWNGCWSYNLIYNIFNPLKWYTPGSFHVGLNLSFQFTIYVVSVVFLVFTLFRNIWNIRNISINLFFSFILLVMILNAHLYEEIFGWYVGSKYIAAVVLTFVCIVLEFWYLKKKTVLRGTFLALIGFAACMMVNSAVMIGSIYLLLIYTDIRGGRIKSQKEIFLGLIPFFFCVAGGLVYAFCPGNYIRQNSIDATGIHPVKSLLITAVDMGISLADIFTHYIVVFGFIFCAFVAFFLAKKKIIRCSFLKPWIPFLLSVIVNFVVILPAAAGYASIALPTRLMFLVYNYIIISFMLSFINLGFFLAEKYGNRVGKKDMIYIVVIMIMTFYAAAGNREYIESTPYAKQFLEHSKVVEYNRNWTDIFNEIKESKEEDVVVDSAGRVLFVDLLEAPYIIGNPNFGVNKGAARYFGKKSIRVINWIDDL